MPIYGIWAGPTHIWERHNAIGFKGCIKCPLPYYYLLFVIYLKFLITLVKGMFDLQIDKKKKKTKTWS
jgi:hypothetical protein